MFFSLRSGCEASLLIAWESGALVPIVQRFFWFEKFSFSPLLVVIRH